MCVCFLSALFSSFRTVWNSIPIPPMAILILIDPVCWNQYKFLQNRQSEFCRAYASDCKGTDHNKWRWQCHFNILFTLQNKKDFFLSSSLESMSLKTISTLLKTRWIETISNHLTRCFDVMYKSKVEQTRRFCMKVKVFFSSWNWRCECFGSMKSNKSVGEYTFSFKSVKLKI